MEQRRVWGRKNKEYILNYAKKYKITNKGPVNALNALRKSHKNNRATPPWARAKTPMFDETKIVYTNCPVGFTVDHIIPLSSKEACGLHVCHNLQYLVPNKNFSKQSSLPSQKHLNSKTALRRINSPKQQRQRLEILLGHKI
jgi:hypothetical protein